MLKHETKIWHRLVAFLLSFVMVLSLLPANMVHAEETPEENLDDTTATEPVTPTTEPETSEPESSEPESSEPESSEPESSEPESSEPETVGLGTVATITSGGVVNESIVTFTNLTLNWEAADASIGREWDGWWVGIKVEAPEGMTDGQLANAKFGRPSGDKVSFKDEMITENGTNYVTIWSLVTAEYLVNYNPLTYTHVFDWDGDNIFEQTVKTVIDPSNITLMKGEEEVFPAPYGAGLVSSISEGGSVAGSVVTFADVTLDWVAKDESIGRTQDGWWVGIKVEAPQGMTDEQLANAKFGRPSGDKVSFKDEMITENGTNYVTIWSLVTADYLANYNPLTYTQVFDWNGDGYFEQTVKTVIDPSNIVLMQDGEQVYPAVPEYTVTFTHGAGDFTDVDGQKLDSVTVKSGKSVSFKYTFDDTTYELTVKVGETVLVADEQGVYTISNITENYTVTAEIKDITPPTITDEAVSGDGNWTTSKTITFTADDNSGEFTTYVSTTKYETAEALLAANEPIQTSCTVTTHIGAGQSVTYYIYALDAAGNMETVEVPVSKIDRVKPDVQNHETDKDFVTEKHSFTVLEQDSGVASVIVTSTDIWGNEKTETLRPDRNGLYRFEALYIGTYKITVTDNAGNIFTCDVNALDIDTAIPTVQLPTEDICTNQNIYIEATFSDNQDKGNSSGVVNLYYTTTESTDDNRDPKAKKVDVSGKNSYNIPGPENNFEGTYYVWVEDASGKLSKIATINVMKDIVVPVVNSATFISKPTQVEKKDKNTWLYYANSVDISIDASDDLSGVVKYEYRTITGKDNYGEWQTAAATVDENGIATFTVSEDDFEGRIMVRVTDKAGNQSVYGKDDKNKTSVVYHPGYNNATHIVINEDKAQTPLLEVTLTTKNDSNEVISYNGEWTKYDVVITLNSSISAGISHYQYSTDSGENWKDLAVNSSTANDNLYTLTIEDNTNATYIFRAVSNNTDAEGNLIAGNNSAEYTVKVYKTAPDEASMTISGEKTSLENDWYISVPTINITEPVSAYPGDLSITTEFMIEKVGGKCIAWTPVSEIGNLTALLMGLNGETGDYKQGKADGQYIIKIRVKDGAGNETLTFLNVTGTDAETGDPIGDSLPELSFNVDTTAPTDLTITYTYEKVKMQEKKNEYGEPVLDENGKPVMEPVLDENGKPVMETIVDNLVSNSENVVFNKFYNSAITIELNAKFDISQKSSLKYLILPNYGEYKEDSEDHTNAWVPYEESGIVINPNEKFVLIFRAEDNAGNVTVINSTGIIVDDKAPAGGNPDAETQEAPEIEITIPETGVTNGYHTGNFDITVHVADPDYKGNQLTQNSSYSGLAKVIYRLYTTDTKETYDEEFTWKFEELKDSFEFDVPVDANKYNSNNVYLEITAVDNAGNTRVTTSEVIMIDVTHPEINVTYEDTVTPEHDIYYKAGRTAVIKVTERNFDPSGLKISLTRDGTVVDIDTDIENWIKGTTGEENVKNGDDTTWSLYIPCETDGDYVLTITELKDKAGLAVEERESNEYVFHDNFVVDTKLPKITVSYDNNTVSKEKYFKAARTVTIVVEEHNFDRVRTVVTINASLDGQAIQVPGYYFNQNVNNPDFWTASITLDHDGDYTFAVEATDMAGNENDGVTYVNAVAPTNFTIDTTIHAPTVGGGVEDGGSYNEEVKPSVDVTDVNYEGHTIKLTRTSFFNNEKDQDVTNQFINYVIPNAQGATVNYEDFPHTRENDGIYTLTVTITDKAGNYTVTVTTFTVNRFGSEYISGEYLDQVTDGYVQVIEQDLTLTEINPDQLVDGSVQIEITRDGKPVDNVEPNVSLVTPSESGWYEYLHTISKDYFTEEGVYKITILSEDKTGNKCQSETITFRVDKSTPELSSVVGLEERIINAQEVDVRYTAFDAIGLKSIEVIVNGETVDLITDFDDPNNFSGSFKLTESNDAQSVQIIVTDLAGNVLDTDAKDFTSAYEFNNRVTVSTNWFVRWFANKPLFFGSLAGIGGAGWLLWFLIFGKRKKEEEEEQAV